MRFDRRLLVAACVLALPAAFANPARAQAPADPPPARPAVRRVPLTLVLDSAADGGAPSYRIVRRVGAEPRELLVIRGAPDARSFSEAVGSLLTLRAALGDSVRAAGDFRVRRGAGAPAAPYPLAERVLHDLRAAAPRSVPGYGRVRAVEIWLPRQRR